MRANYDVHRDVRRMGAGREFQALQRRLQIPVEIGLSPVEVDGEIFVLASIVDITRRRHAEQLAHVREQAYSTLLELVSHAIMVADRRAAARVNARACDLTGISRDEFLQDGDDSVPRKRRPFRRIVEAAAGSHRTVERRLLACARRSDTSGSERDATSRSSGAGDFARHHRPPEDRERIARARAALDGGRRGGERHRLQFDWPDTI